MVFFRSERSPQNDRFRSAGALCSYYSGYAVGSRDVRIEYVTKEVEVVRYVDKKKAKIYSSPAAVPADLIKLFNDGKL